MELRAATSTEADQIATIWNYYITQTSITFTTVEQTSSSITKLITKRKNEGHPFYVAMDGKTVLGFATYNSFRNGTGYSGTKEHTVIISQDYLGHGVGAALMNKIQHHALSHKVTCLIAGISGENQAAVDFHAKLGFSTQVTLYKVGNKFDRYHDLVLMQKLL